LINQQLETQIKATLFNKAFLGCMPLPDHKGGQTIYLFKVSTVKKKSYF